MRLHRCDKLSKNSTFFEEKNFDGILMQFFFSTWSKPITSEDFRFEKSSSFVKKNSICGNWFIPINTPLLSNCCGNGPFAVKLEFQDGSYPPRWKEPFKCRITTAFFLLGSFIWYLLGTKMASAWISYGFTLQLICTHKMVLASVPMHRIALAMETLFAEEES